MLQEEKESEDFQKKWDEILHGTNPATIYGTRRLEWEDVLEVGVFAGKFNALFSLLEKYADALSQSHHQGYEEGIKEMARVGREAMQKRREVYLAKGMGAIGGWNMMSHGHLDTLAAFDQALKDLTKPNGE